jgi:serine/threonine-protein kinase
VSDATTHPKPGTVIAGKYRVERVIGKGGMGVVVAAEHTLLKQRVALKFVLDTADHDATDRFMREARATARLESAHVCRVMDVGTTDSGAPYIVMELLSGMDLSARLLAFGALPIADAVDYTLQLLDALSEAHARGIVHRDLKPSNLFLANRGDGSSILKVLDFGISKLQASPHDADTESTNRGAGTPKPVDPAQGLTETGVMMGSPPYMSPEQLRSARDVDARCDVWSVGTILHELLTATRAFPPGDDLFARILTGHHPSVRALRPEVPEELARIVDRCLSVDPEARFPSAAEVAVALAPFGPPHTKVHVERAARWLANSGSGSSPAVASMAPLPPSSGSAVPQTVHGVSLAPSASGASTARWWPRVTALAIAVAVVSMGAVVVQQRSARTRAAAIAPPPPSIPADSNARTAVAPAVPASASALAPAPAPALASAPAPDDAGARHPPRARTGAPHAKPAASGEGVDLGRL